MPVTIVQDLKVELQAAVQAAVPSSVLSPLIQTIPTMEDLVNVYGLGSGPRIKRVRGEIVTVRLNEHQFNLKPEKFGAGIEFDVDRMDHHVIGDQYSAAINKLAQAAVDYPAEHFLTEVMPALSSDPGWDGVAFFSANHPIADANGMGAVQSNIVDTTVVDPNDLTMTEAITAWRATLEKLRTMKNNNGAYINRAFSKLLLFTGVHNGTIMEQLFSMPLLPGGGGAPNPYVTNAVTVVPTPELTDESEMMLFDVSNEAPILYARQIDVTTKEGVENVKSQTKPVVAYLKLDGAGVYYQKGVKLTLSV